MATWEEWHQQAINQEIVQETVACLLVWALDRMHMLDRIMALQDRVYAMERAQDAQEGA